MMKKILKNLFACFLILVVCAVAVFFIGWTSLRVSPDSIGVVKSKTGGIQKEPVCPGKFAWNWEFLLPTNTKLEIFDLKPYSVGKKISGSLPSAELYSTLLNSSANFSYNFDFDFSVNVSAEAIVSLYGKLVFSDQKGLERYIDQSCDSAAKMLSSAILKKLERDPFFQPETLTQEDLFSLVDLDRKIPGLKFSSIILNECSYPDYAMYKSVCATFLSKIKEVMSELENSPDSEENADFINRLKNFFNKQE